MAIRAIITNDNEILHKKSRPVQFFDSKLIDLLDDMHETLVKVDGVGIAAPQIGLLRRIIVINHEDRLYEIINPEIVFQKGEQKGQEACLSCPGIYGVVRRPMVIKINAYDRNGNQYVLKGKDLLARVLSHELDHLDGILYTDITNEIYKNKDEKKKKKKRR